MTGSIKIVETAVVLPPVRHAEARFQQGSGTTDFSVIATVLVRPQRH